MYKKITKYLIVAPIIILGISGCSSIYPRACTPKARQSGYLCYQGFNFGRHKSLSYKKGIRDGCRTANGYFHKNYSLSASSLTYIKGWDMGRATCKLIVPASAQTNTMRTEYQQSLDKQNNI